MNIKSTAIQKEDISFSQFFIEKNINLKKIVIPLFVVLIFSFVLIFNSKGFLSNDYSKDMLVADFRTDVNKLWEASSNIEAERNSSVNLNLHEFGASGTILNTVEINPNLKRALISIADLDKDNKLSEDEIKALGIMNLNEEQYSKELKNLQFYSLSTDNNLKHYVIITKGSYAGTVLYNGDLKFIDSNKRSYFGVEFFEQL